ncbi:hypothetical protein QYF61_001740 [Mycteria americana]|uniref:Bcl-x interacting BH3 domain-containing protein n=1 Tax=Mycteria americana TaxID=33587 RepID=A0AAN7S069_MYCAM|nr:hypothetical protein QYF61_001740 [Mycteria americana]
MPGPSPGRRRVLFLRYYSMKTKQIPEPSSASSDSCSDPTLGFAGEGRGGTASQWQSHSLAEDIQPEIWIAQELRRIGDEFNASYCPRRVTFMFLLSISLRTVSKREKLNHLWKLVLR